MTNLSTDTALDAILAQASALGADAGRNAATWVTDGNTTTRTYATILAGIVDGDPAVLDAYRLPDLSGEFADAWTPASLGEALGYETDADDWQDIEADVCEAWEMAVSDAFWAELERVCRLQVQS